MFPRTSSDDIFHVYPWDGKTVHLSKRLSHASDKFACECHIRSLKSPRVGTSLGDSVNHEFALPRVVFSLEFTLSPLSMRI